MGALLCAATAPGAGTLYVDLGGTSAGPGTTWSNAFHTIQGAVDVALEGDTVLVSNGVYSTAQTVAPGQSVSNRVTIAKNIVVCSVNGPTETVITGGGDMGPGAIRCAYVAGGTLAGFTLTGGRTGYAYNSTSGGGLYAQEAVISNCVVENCKAFLYGGGIYALESLISDCIVQSNATDISSFGYGNFSGGGGIYLHGGVLENSLITANKASDARQDAQNEEGEPAGEGGGILADDGAVILGCTVTHNQTGRGSDGRPWEGGRGTGGGNGGGILMQNGGMVSNCLVHSNSTGDGGDAVEDDSAQSSYDGANGGSGGGIYATANSGMVLVLDCVISNNLTGNGGAGASVEDDYNASSGSGGSGGGIIVLNNGRIANCLIAGNQTGDGADGDTVSVWSGSGGYCGGFRTDAGVLIEDCTIDRNSTGTGGAPDFLRGDIGGGLVAGSGKNLVVVNNDAGDAGGLSCGSVSNCLVTGNAGRNGGGIRVSSGGKVIDCLVSNNTASADGGGIYIYGNGTVSGGVVCENISQNYGGGVYAYYGEAALDGLIFDNTAMDGGGIYLLFTSSDCLAHVYSNRATSVGGGLYAYYSTCRGVHLSDNRAERSMNPDTGGGAHLVLSALHHATIHNNYANAIAAAGLFLDANSQVLNSIICSNSPGADVAGSGLVSNCCGPALSPPGNIAESPLLQDWLPTGGRLLESSPCIDTALASGLGVDLEGVPRPLDGDANGTCTSDIGCREYINAAADSDSDGMPDRWEWDHGLFLTDAGDALEDVDVDGENNFREYVADTNPTNPTSYLRVTGISNGPSLTITFEPASTARDYSLQGTTNLLIGPWADVSGQGPRAGGGGEDAMSDNPAAPTSFYRIKVELP